MDDRDVQRVSTRSVAGRHGKAIEPRRGALDPLGHGSSIHGDGELVFRSIRDEAALITELEYRWNCPARVRVSIGRAEVQPAHIRRRLPPGRRRHRVFDVQNAPEIEGAGAELRAGANEPLRKPSSGLEQCQDFVLRPIRILFEQQCDRSGHDR